MCALKFMGEDKRIRCDTFPGVWCLADLEGYSSLDRPFFPGRTHSLSFGTVGRQLISSGDISRYRGAVGALDTW